MISAALQNKQEESHPDFVRQRCEEEERKIKLLQTTSKQLTSCTVLTCRFHFLFIVHVIFISVVM